MMRLSADAGGYWLHHGDASGNVVRTPVDAMGTAGPAEHVATGSFLEPPAVSGDVVAFHVSRSATSDLALVVGGTASTLTGEGPYGYLQIATAGPHHLLLWQNALNRLVMPPTQVRALVIDASGAPLATTSTVLDTGAPGPLPSVAFDGTSHLTVWSSRDDLYGVRLSPTGALREAPVPLSEENGLEQRSAVASDGAGHAFVAYQRFVSGPTANEVQVRARVVDMTRAGTLGAGASCVSSWACATGHCVDGVCCDTACGLGADDCEVCSATLGAVADGTCSPALAGASCRPSAGPCDIAETCDGVSSACPTDAFAPAATACGGPALDACDTEDVCDGTSADCPDAPPLPAGTVCAPAVGPCDAAETCDGESTRCPFDWVLDPTEVCRAATGPCDTSESCDGVSKTCPPDSLLDATQVCRPADGVCDVAETCDGSTPACPDDGFAASGTPCRPAESSCDLEETCSGADPGCPPDGALDCDDGLVCNGVRACRDRACVDAAPPIQCADGMVCAEPEGACVPETPPDEPGGCECRAVEPHGGSDAFGSLACPLLLVSLAARRRRKRRDGDRLDGP
jgi:hypothetical protein